MLHGRKYEKLAIRKAEEKKDVVIKNCGLMVDGEMPYLAATPDGSTSDMLVEVKCPYKGRNEEIRKSAVFFPFLDQDDDGELIVKKKHVYYAQIQGQLMIAKKQNCLFAVYTFVDFACIDVKYDHIYCETVLKPALSKFYTQYYRSYVAKTLYI